jgi:hypothetical protein
MLNIILEYQNDYHIRKSTIIKLSIVTSLQAKNLNDNSYHIVSSQVNEEDARPESEGRGDARAGLKEPIRGRSTTKTYNIF